MGYGNPQAHAHAHAHAQAQAQAQGNPAATAAALNGNAALAAAVMGNANVAAAAAAMGGINANAAMAQLMGGNLGGPSAADLAAAAAHHGHSVVHQLAAHHGMAHQLAAQQHPGGRMLRIAGLNQPMLSNTRSVRLPNMPHAQHAVPTTLHAGLSTFAAIAAANGQGFLPSTTGRGGFGSDGFRSAGGRGSRQNLLDPRGGFGFNKGAGYGGGGGGDSDYDDEEERRGGSRRSAVDDAEAADAAEAVLQQVEGIAQSLRGALAHIEKQQQHQALQEGSVAPGEQRAGPERAVVCARRFEDWTCAMAACSGAVLHATLSEPPSARLWIRGIPVLFDPDQ